MAVLLCEGKELGEPEGFRVQVGRARTIMPGVPGLKDPDRFSCRIPYAWRWDAFDAFSAGKLIQVRFDDGSVRELQVFHSNVGESAHLISGIVCPP